MFCVEHSVVWIWRRIERVKWTDKIKNAVVLERMGEGRILLELIKKKKRNWLGHWVRRNYLLKNALEGMVNVKKVRGRIKYQIYLLKSRIKNPILNHSQKFMST